MGASGWSGPALVVFDLIGTTVRDDGQIPAAFAVALADHGLAITPEQLVELRGASKREAIARLTAAGPEHAQRAAAVYASFHRHVARHYAQGGGVVAMPGAVDTFGWLRARGVRIALNTGFDRGITDLLVAALRWSAQVVDAVVCVDDVARGRPAPDLIHCAMARTGVADPAQVANVGDTALDLAAAQVAGVRWNIGVWSGAHRRERLLAAPHTHLLPGVAELPSLW